MTEPLNTSFIPKRNSNTPTRRTSTQRVFIGTILIQVFFFAVLLVSLFLFVYEKKLNHDLEAEVANLNEAIKSFNEEKMNEIVSIDTRISQVKDRLDHTASISAIFSAMESATVQSIQIESLKLKRDDDSTISMEAEMKADSFDSLMFQRGVLERDEKLSVTNIKELKISNPKAESVEVEKKTRASEVKEKPSEFSVKFKAELALDSASVPHVPVTIQSLDNSTTINSNNTTSGTDDMSSSLMTVPGEETTLEAVNQGNI